MFKDRADHFSPQNTLDRLFINVFQLLFDDRQSGVNKIKTK